MGLQVLLLAGARQRGLVVAQSSCSTKLFRAMGHPLLVWVALAAAVVLSHGADNHDSLGHASAEVMLSKQDAEAGRADVESMFREFFATQEVASPSLELIDLASQVPESSQAVVKGGSTSVPHAMLVKLPPGMQLPPGATCIQQVNQEQHHPAPQVQEVVTRAQAHMQARSRIPLANAMHPVAKQAAPPAISGQARGQTATTQSGTPLQIQRKVQVQTQVAAPKLSNQSVPAQKPQLQSQASKHIVVVMAKTKKQTQAQAKKLAKKKAKKKLHLARQFNKFVKQVDSILDDAMKKLKKDKKLFHKAVQDGHKKQVVLQHQAQGARRHANGDSVKIDAIQTHMALAQRAGARAFIKFVNSFRTGAKKNFRASYKNAKIHERQLKKIYHKICHRVSHAWKAMKGHGKKLHATYMTALKHYWKAKYSCVGDKKKPSIKVALKKARHNAKQKMKHARSQQWHFKRSMSKAHHHAKKLRKGLQQALRKIHFVFKKARSMYRHTAKTFMIGFVMQVAAQKPVRKGALRRLQKRQLKRKQLKKQKHPKKHIQGHHQHARKLAKKEKQTRKSAGKVKVVGHVSSKKASKMATSTKKASKQRRLDSAEKKAVKIVKRAILQQQRAVSRSGSDPVIKQKIKSHVKQHLAQDLAEENTEDLDEDDELWEAL